MRIVRKIVIPSANSTRLWPRLAWRSTTGRDADRARHCAHGVTVTTCVRVAVPPRFETTRMIVYVALALVDVRGVLDGRHR